MWLLSADLTGILLQFTSSQLFGAKMHQSVRLPLPSRWEARKNDSLGEIIDSQT